MSFYVRFMVFCANMFVQSLVIFAVADILYS